VKLPPVQKTALSLVIQPWRASPHSGGAGCSSTPKPQIIRQPRLLKLSSGDEVYSVHTLAGMVIPAPEKLSGPRLISAPETFCSVKTGTPAS